MTKILIIADNAAMLRALQRFLAFEEFEVHGVLNGHTAVDRARETSPDLIVCDILMSEDEGYAMLRRLHEIPALARVPIVALAARCDEAMLKSTTEWGVVDCLTKPFDPEALLGVIRRHLRGAGQ